MDNFTERTLSRTYESLDYDLMENVIQLEHQHKSRFKNFINRSFQRWVAILIIAIATAISGFFANFSVNFLTHAKFSEIIQASNRQCQEEKSRTEILTYPQLFGCMWPSYLIWLAWNILPSLLGCLMVTYIAPIAAGSGIPVVKCYLNGVNIPEVNRFKTYVCKLLGVIMSVVGGLAVGKEGPFIHCGAAIAAGLSQGKSTSFKWSTRLFKSFRNDRDKRDFVSAGASAGVAAAFGAPIGGVLFALEEGASFWNQALTWRIFFCSMMTSFILNLFMTAYNQKAGVLEFRSLVNFGLVEELDYFWFEIPVYICLAVAGGILGASFCYTNLIITRLRRKFVIKKWMKVLDTIIVAVVAATIGAALIIFASDCRKLPKTSQSFNGNLISKPIHLSLRATWVENLNLFNHSSMDELTEHISGGMLNNHIMTFMCPPGEYSAMSSLWLKTSEGVSSTFMVLEDDIWSMKTLLIFLVIYYLLAVVTYGLSISSGVFIPSLLIGATGGRLVGLILRHFLGPLPWLVKQKKFAIIGAASVLGGVVRMTISLTVIIVEATGCISFGLPIMICLMVSKWVADSFIEGLYDLAIKMANVPFLEWEPPRSSYSKYANEVMSHNVKVVNSTETVANLISILKSCTHNGFPVVNLNDENVAELGTAISNEQCNVFYFTPSSNPNCDNMKEPLVKRNTTSINDDSLGREHLTGSFQRCSVTPKRVSYGRFRGLVLRWQILVMLHLKIFNENERSFEKLNLETFQESYPEFPSLDEVLAGLSDEMYNFHVDLRSIMNPSAYTVQHSASFPRIFRIFRSLGLRHLVVVDDRNQIVGMITRKDLARYVRERDAKGFMHMYELRYSS